MSIDGTCFTILQPSPFSDKWYDEKSNGPGIKYEVGVSLYSSSICWIKGPFPSGRFNDETVFVLFLSAKLLPGEKCIADNGYSACHQCTTPEPGQSMNVKLKMSKMSKIRSRQEHVNKRLKQFGVLRRVYRHDRQLHKHCMYAVSVVTQLSIMFDEPLDAAFY